MYSDFTLVPFLMSITITAALSTSSTVQSAISSSRKKLKRLIRPIAGLPDFGLKYPSTGIDVLDAFQYQKDLNQAHAELSWVQMYKHAQEPSLSSLDRLRTQHVISRSDVTFNSVVAFFVAGLAWGIYGLTYYVKSDDIDAYGDPVSSVHMPHLFTQIVWALLIIAVLVTVVSAGLHVYSKFITDAMHRWNTWRVGENHYARSLAKREAIEKELAIMNPRCEQLRIIMSGQFTSI